ncbi:MULTISPECIES: phosphatase domain-containing protein [unclassified Streptomyces]|uniref:phosphatase domain-containing protein n=1 Tax=Streptomyces sp. NPDC055082 TaxID=3365718 RepID=UPI0037D53FA7
MSDDARPLAVFDLDGTLADTAHRQHFLEGRTKDWDSFFTAAVDDPPLRDGVALALTSAEECEIVYLTGRPERCRRDTVEWLARQGLPEGGLHMRRNGDRRPARRTKLDSLKRLGRGREVRVFVDDDAFVCDAAEVAGFTVVRADWAEAHASLKDAQEREGRT